MNHGSVTCKNKKAINLKFFFVSLRSLRLIFERKRFLIKRNERKDTKTQSLPRYFLHST